MADLEAVPVPIATALKLLNDRFPDLSHSFGKPNDPEPGDPYVSYELFADEIVRRRSDGVLLARLYSFMNELALSDDPTLESLLYNSVLESLVQDAELISNIYKNTNAKTQEAVKSVYGRVPDESAGRSPLTH